MMKEHAELGYKMINDSDRPLLVAAAIIAHEHHEKYDGSGYPRGLFGTDIHIYGRITALADVFDALGSKRAYKEKWSDEKIFEYIKKQSGKHFDPILVNIFFTNLDEFLAVRDELQNEDEEEVVSC
nr:HD domain-containing phosphohydrolase [Sulfurimonas sp. SAG-AH-194-I05]